MDMDAETPEQIRKFRQMKEIEENIADLKSELRKADRRITGMVALLALGFGFVVLEIVAAILVFHPWR